MPQSNKAGTLAPCSTKDGRTNPTVAKAAVIALRPTVAHEAARRGTRLRSPVRIGPGREEHLDRDRAPGASSRAECRMQRGLAGIPVGVVGIRAVFEQEFAQLPVAVKGGRIQPEVRS